MRRRDFIALAGGAVAWPPVARAQQNQRMRHIGALLNLSESDPDGQQHVSVLRQRLQELGWVERQNAQKDIRWGAGDRGRYRVYASELVKSDPDVIFAATTDAVIGFKMRRVPYQLCLRRASIQ